MEKQQLMASLQRLHDELSQAERVDPETLALLRALTDDTERLLKGDPEASARDIRPVSHGLRDLMLRFEAEHPEAASAIGKVADALAAIGI
jgi:hypothetical protein